MLGASKLTIIEGTVAVGLAKITSPSAGKDSGDEKQTSVQHRASFGVGFRQWEARYNDGCR